MAYVRERFENLDVMNNFMFNKLTTHPEVQEGFCRCMIRNLIGKEVGTINIQTEKIEFPDDPEKRGIRLDVKVEELEDGETVASIFDIEPHRDLEKNYPKKSRFQQAQIDKNCMKSGDNDFSHMPELYIICITNYDPFGYDQILYTIKNMCAEEPELVYNDGVRILYFNTSGTKGGTKSLQNFLHYLENSDSRNVVDDATKELNDYTQVIKHNYEIGGMYMTVGDLMDKIVAESVEEALAEMAANKDSIIANKDLVIADKDLVIADKDSLIAEKDEEIARLKRELALLNGN